MNGGAAGEGDVHRSNCGLFFKIQYDLLNIGIALEMTCQMYQVAAMRTAINEFTCLSCKMMRIVVQAHFDDKWRARRP